MCEAISFERRRAERRARDLISDCIDSGPSHDGPVMGVVSGSRELMKFFLESLILAQDERWRRA